MQILGLHFDRPFIRWATINRKSKKVEIVSLKSFIPISPEDVKQLYIGEKKDYVATGIKAVVRPLRFKITSRKQIEAGLPFQVESLTHLGLNDLVFSSQISIQKTGADATVFLSSKEVLSSHLHNWSQYSVSPDLVTSVEQALLRFAQFRIPELKEGFLVYLGSEELTCVCFKHGIIVKSFVIDEGVESLLSALWEDRKKVLFQSEVEGVAKQIDLFQLKLNLNPQLFKRVESLRNKLRSVILSFRQTSGPLPLFFAGRTDSFSQFCNYLVGAMPEVPHYLPPLPIHLDELKTAIAIGMALESYQPNRCQVQFLRGEFIPIRQWKKVGMQAIGLIALSLMMTAGFLSFGLSKLNEQKNQIAQAFKTVVGQIDNGLEASLFKDGIDQGVDQAMRMISKHSKEAPYLLQTPTVSEVLAWVSKQQELSSVSKQQELSSTGKVNDPIDLIDLRYQLVSFPKIGSARDPYLAKIEMQFTCKNAMTARKFHEELLKGDYLVDSNQEITWEALSDAYQVSFYLKNRTPYVR